MMFGKTEQFPMSICNAQSYKKLMLYTILGLFGIVMIAPFLWMISTSLKPPSQIAAFPPRWIPKPIVWGNYREAWNLLPFNLYFLHSLVVAMSVTSGQLITSSMGAFAFARLRFRGREPLFLVYLGTMMIPFQVLMIPIYLLMKSFGLIDTLQALILPHIFSAYSTFLLRQFFLTIPRELEEAAEIDGCGYMRRYSTIILPLSKPALTTVGIFTFMWSWNDFMWALIVTQSDHSRTLPMGLAMFQNMFTVQTPWNLMMAAAVIALLPVLVVFVLAQKQFIEGITLTGLKG